MQCWQNSKPARQCLSLSPAHRALQVKVCPWCREELPVSSFTGHLGLEQVPELSPASIGTNWRGCVQGRLSVHFILLHKKTCGLANFKTPLKLDLGGVSKYTHINFFFFKHCFSGAHLHKNRPWFQSMFLNRDNFYTCFVLCRLQKQSCSSQALKLKQFFSSCRAYNTKSFLLPSPFCHHNTPSFSHPLHISVSACSVPSCPLTARANLQPLITTQGNLNTSESEFKPQKGLLSRSHSNVAM